MAQPSASASRAPSAKALSPPSTKSPTNTVTAGTDLQRRNDLVPHRASFTSPGCSPEGEDRTRGRRAPQTSTDHRVHNRGAIASPRWRAGGGTITFDCEPRGDKVKVLPPYPVSCGVADKWRNNYCGGLPDTTNPPLAEMGTERDWMQFYWSWNTRGPSNASLEEIYRTNQQACNPDTCVDADGARIPGCVPDPATCIDADGARIPSCIPARCAEVPAGTWKPQPVRFTWLQLPTPPMGADQATLNDFARTRSYSVGVVQYYDAEVNAAIAAGDAALEAALADRRGHFIQMADDHGVNENTSP